MTVDVVNAQKEKVDSVELSEDVFGGRVNTGLIWEAVVHQNATERRGTSSVSAFGSTVTRSWRERGAMWVRTRIRVRRTCS